MLKHTFSKGKTFISAYAIAIVSFVVIYSILAFFVKDLQLYLDDFIFIFPAVIKSYASHFIQYTYDFGLFRPLALLYYYAIYTVYTVSSQLAHLIPYTIHAASAIFLGTVLRKQHVHQHTTLLLMLLFLVFPFATEQYMWLSANPGTVVTGIFLLQIIVLIYGKPRLGKIVFVTVLQLISSLVYEAGLFFCIPLAYLALTQSTTKRTQQVITVLLFSLPLAIYFASKLLFPPHLIQQRLTVQTIDDILQNIQMFYAHMHILFTNTYAMNEFWRENITTGASLILQQPTLLLLVVVFLTMPLILLIKKQHLIITTIQKKTLYFWLLVCLTSFLPPFFLKNYNFPFRVLFLPMLFLVVILSLSIQRYIDSSWIKKGLFGLGWGVVILFLCIDISISKKYVALFHKDIQLTMSLQQIVTKQGFSDNNPTYVLIENYPKSHGYQEFIYGDHLLSCFNYYWCAQASLNMITGVVKDTGIQSGSTSPSRSFNPSYETFLLQRPLMIVLYDRKHSFTVKHIQQ